MDLFTHAVALVAAEPLDASGGDGIGADMRRVCVAVGRAVAASGVGMTVMTRDGARGVTAATDPATERLEELQLTMGEGPCIEAFERRRPILVPRLVDGATVRWPGYAPAIYDSGVRAVFAFPLQVGAARLGVMDVFRGVSGALSAEDLALALAFADVAVTTLLDGRERVRPDEDEGGFGDVLGSRAEVFQAQGMVMVQLGIPLADALARIRAHAYAENRSLREVAADIVARRLSFEPERP
jgi:hypothetical protein